MKFIVDSLRVDVRAFLLEYSTFVKYVSHESKTSYVDGIYTRGGFIIGCTYYAMDYIYFIAYAQSKRLTRICNALRGRGGLGKIIYDVETDSLIYVDETEYNTCFQEVNVVVQRFVTNYSMYKTKIKNNFNIEFIIYPRLYGTSTLLYVCEIWHWDVNLHFTTNERNFAANDFQYVLKQLQAIIRERRIRIYKNGYMLPNMCVEPKSIGKVEYNDELPF